MTADAVPGASLRILSHPVAGRVPPLVPRAGGFDASLRAACAPGEAADRLAEPDALAVTTGQQPGLFGGPMYVVHKALAARALARELERAWGRPVVPVFWLAGDDHDWAEATRTAWWTRKGEVVEWALPARDDGAPQRPMSAEPLPDQVRLARDRLADDLPEGPDRDRTLDWIDRHWRPGVSVQAAYLAGLGELLAPLGVCCLDATAPALKHAAVPLIRAALEDASRLDATIAAAGDVGTGIAAGEGATLVFVEASAGRDRLITDGEGFRTRRGGESWSRQELFALLDRAPQRFSANVLLRPVLEASLLPTVAYVAGPGEYRYLTRQAALLYPPLGVTPQAPVPRWGGTVVDAVSERLLRRLELDAGQVLHDDGTLGREVLRRDLAPRIPGALADLRAAIDQAAIELDRLGKSIDPVLERAIETRRHRLLHVAGDLERLMERHLRKRDDIAYAQYRRVRRRLRPLDESQERLIGVAAALGMWGDRWLDAVAAAAREWASDVVGRIAGAARN